MAFIEIDQLEKKFDTVVAVGGVSLSVEKGEFLTLLGPSGCGKTTILRCLAGLEHPDRGEIRIAGKTVVAPRRNIFVEPDKRGLGMVFQSYAIWPHLTVFENIAYPLKERKMPKGRIREKVEAILSMVKLEGLENRPATNLSGGQQQRVAVARALVYNPEVLLFDEPLSNLDAKLRIEMRNEIRSLKKSLGITSVYVTHDQEEAFALSDRIIVMNRGLVEQEGDQVSLYFRPESSFVSQFIGETNTFEGKVVEAGQGTASIRLFDRVIPVKLSQKVRTGVQIFLSVRPEYITVNPDRDMEVRLHGVVAQKHYLGPYCKFIIRAHGYEIIAEKRGITFEQTGQLPNEGDEIMLGFSMADANVLSR